MRGGNTRATMRRTTAATRRRRSRFTHEPVRNLWGSHQKPADVEDFWDDDDPDPTG